MTKKTIRIHIVTCSSPDREQVLEKNIDGLKNLGFKVVLFQSKNPLKNSWPFTAGEITDRARIFQKAFDNCDVLFATRGGYGASDILPFLDYKKIKSAPGILVGFSDISALHSAIYAKTKKTGVHGNMPGSTMWNFGGQDVVSVLKWIRDPKLLAPIRLHKITPQKNSISGRIFGGNLATLANLIGTSYIPKSLAGHILFFEDIGENGGKIMRYFNQWQQSGLLREIKAIILGKFTNLERDVTAKIFYRQLAKQLPGIPLFSTEECGHSNPNMPILIGGNYKILKNYLRYLS